MRACASEFMCHICFIYSAASSSILYRSSSVVSSFFHHQRSNNNKYYCSDVTMPPRWQLSFTKLHKVIKHFRPFSIMFTITLMLVYFLKSASSNSVNSQPICTRMSDYVDCFLISQTGIWWDNTLGIKIISQYYL